MARNILIMRHGERVDYLFGSDWYSNNFENGIYKRSDLNMPESLPERSESEWKSDSPLTTTGAFQAQLLGASLKDHGVDIKMAVCSPAYRCIQTSHEILKGMKLEKSIPICIEPGFFEWMPWGNKKLPGSKYKQLQSHFNIDSSYKEIITREKLLTQCNETIEDYYTRNSSTFREIIESTDGDLLLVGHDITLDTSTRQLRGKEPLSTKEFYEFLGHVPYLATLAIQEVAGSRNPKLYEFVDVPAMPMSTYMKFHPKIFDF